MHITLHPDHKAAVFAPEPGDDPDDFEDAVHDEVVKGRAGKPKGERSDVLAVVLDLSVVEKPGPWMKAAGPQIPDVNLRVVLAGQGYVMARALNLTAVFDWYSSVDEALRQGV